MEAKGCLSRKCPPLNPHRLGDVLTPAGVRDPEALVGGMAVKPQAYSLQPENVSTDAKAQSSLSLVEGCINIPNPDEILDHLLSPLGSTRMDRSEHHFCA